jgi:D-alanine-D-alanine ligase
MRVAVIVGGRSEEAVVTRVSGEHVSRAIAKLGHQPVIVEAGRRAWTAKGEHLTLEPGRGLASCHVAFPLVAHLQGLLEALDVPYTGPAAFAAHLTGHKIVCKDLLGIRGIPQVPYREWIDDGDPADLLTQLEFPWFVKPARLGSSIGISKVSALEDLAEAIAHAQSHDPLVIVEQGVEAIELEVGVLGHGEPVASTVGQVIVEPGGWNDYDNKYGSLSPRLKAPADVPPHVEKEAQSLACRAYFELGCSGGARVDLFYLPEQEKLLVNEINASPMYTPSSAFPVLWQASGVDLPGVVEILLEAAFEKHDSQGREKY